MSMTETSESDGDSTSPDASTRGSGDGGAGRFQSPMSRLREVERQSLLHRGVLGLTVVVLVAGAVVVSQISTGSAARVADAEEMVRQFYQAGEPGRVVDRLVEGSLGQDVPQQQLTGAIGQVLNQPLQIESSEAVTVRGSSLVRIQTPQVNWCVTGDQRILLGCRVATAQLQGSPQGAPVQLAFATVDVLATRVNLSAVLTAAGQQPVTLGSEVTLDQPSGGADLAFAGAFNLTGGQRVPVQAGQLTVQPQAGLQLTFESDDVDDVEATLRGPFRVNWDGGGIDLRVGEVTWFIGEPSRGQGGPPPPGADDE